MTYQPYRQEPPRVVDPVANFWDFCREVNLFTRDPLKSRDLLRAEYGKVCPGATPAEVVEDHATIDRILGLHR